MTQFLILIGQLFSVSLIQTIVESFMDSDKHKQQIKFINIAGILGSLYFLVQFAFSYVIREINTFVRFPF